jgi:signal transduction histidine kinase
MNGRGKVTVTTERTTVGVRIRIRDEGAGIPEEAMGRLFQPNFSTKTDGMGLGLAIVRKTVEDLHGTIRAESAPGRGTTMIIEIPAAGGLTEATP